jgi:hypothetical protein
MERVGATGHEQDVCPALDRRAGEQRKLAVIADRDGQPPERGIEDLDPSPPVIAHSSRSKRVITSLSCVAMAPLGAKSRAALRTVRASSRRGALAARM